MSDDRLNDSLEIERERTIALYVLAFDRGDFDALAQILDLAAKDPVLDRRIAGINSALHADAGLPPMEEQAQVVRRLLLRHFPEESAAPVVQPLTVGDVASRLQADYPASGALSEHDRKVNQQLVTSPMAVPLPVHGPSVARLAAQLQLSASDEYWEAFRRTAVLLSIARQRGEIELAAARRQQRPRSSQPSRRRQPPDASASSDQ
jgi:hypothetical protein